jgi:hypothetical protein
MVDDGRRNGVECGEVVQLLETLQQYQRAQLRIWATGELADPSDFIGCRRIALLDVTTGQYIGEPRIGGAFDRCHPASQIRVKNGRIVYEWQ